MTEASTEDNNTSVELKMNTTEATTFSVICKIFPTVNSLRCSVEATCLIKGIHQGLTEDDIKRFLMHNNISAYIALLKSKIVHKRVCIVVFETPQDANELFQILRVKCGCIGLQITNQWKELIILAEKAIALHGAYFHPFITALTGRRLIILNLSNTVSTEGLLDVFGFFGNVIDSINISGNQGGRVGEIIYENPADAALAAASMNGIALDSKSVRVLLYLGTITLLTDETPDFFPIIRIGKNLNLHYRSTDNYEIEEILLNCYTGKGTSYSIEVFLTSQIDN